MVDYKVLLGVLSLAVAALAYSIYFRQILLKKVVPHPFSWMIWGIVEVIVFAAQLVKHAGPGAWATGFTALACFTISILAFFYSKKNNFSQFDWVFLALAIISIFLWLLTKQPVASVILLTLTDALGMLFTLRKTYYNPMEESASLFGLSSIRSAISVFALQTYTLTTWLYPASLILTNILIVVMIIVRRKSLKIHNA